MSKNWIVVHFFANTIAWTVFNRNIHMRRWPKMFKNLQKIRKTPAVNHTQMSLTQYWQHAGCTITGPTLQLEARLLNRVEQCCCFPQDGCVVGVACCTLHTRASAAVILFRCRTSCCTSCMPPVRMPVVGVYVIVLFSLRIVATVSWRNIQTLQICTLFYRSRVCQILFI